VIVSFLHIILFRNIPYNSNPIEMVQKTGLELLNFSSTEAMVLGTLPFYHKDLFGRMLIAQALVNKFYLMTEDPKFLRYECKII